VLCGQDVANLPAERPTKVAKLLLNQRTT
jgi:hypothetical protein